MYDQQLLASPSTWDGTHWSLRAACRSEDPELFFPLGIGHSDASKNQMELARLICRECPLQRWCLAYALRIDAEFGMWGGKTPTERKKLRRGRVPRKRFLQP